MRIWITPDLCDLLTCDGMPVRLVENDSFKETFLSESMADDIAIIEFFDGYLDFLNRAKDKGRNIKTIFISKEPVSILEDMQNAIILDTKRYRIEEIKKIIDLIIRITAHKSQSLTSPPPVFPSRREKSKSIEDEQKIKGILDGLAKRQESLIIGIKISEVGETFTARAACYIRSLSETSIVLYKFRPPALLWGIKPGDNAHINLLEGDSKYNSSVMITKIIDDNVYISFPSFISPDTRNFIRIEPSNKNIVELYMLLKDEPTVLQKVTNISQRGIGFLSDMKLDIGDIYGFTVSLPDPKRILLCYGIIRSRMEYSKAYYYGAEMSFHTNDEQLIAQYIMNRDREIIALLKEMH